MESFSLQFHVFAEVLTNLFLRYIYWNFQEKHLDHHEDKEEHGENAGIGQVSCLFGEDHHGNQCRFCDVGRHASTGQVDRQPSSDL